MADRTSKYSALWVVRIYCTRASAKRTNFMTSWSIIRRRLSSSTASKNDWSDFNALYSVLYWTNVYYYDLASLGAACDCETTNHDKASVGNARHTALEGIGASRLSSCHSKEAWGFLCCCTEDDSPNKIKCNRGVRNSQEIGVSRQAANSTRDPSQTTPYILKAMPLLE